MGYFSSLVSIAQSKGKSVARQIVQGLSLYPLKLQAAAYHLIDPTWQWHDPPSTSTLSHAHHHCPVVSSASFHSVHCFACSSILSLHHSDFCRGTHCTPASMGVRMWGEHVSAQLASSGVHRACHVSIIYSLQWFYGCVCLFLQSEGFFPVCSVKRISGYEFLWSILVLTSCNTFFFLLLMTEGFVTSGLTGVFQNLK